MSELLIRAATAADADALGRMGGALARQHHGFDARRFMLPDDVEAGYRWWLLREAKNKKAVVLVAVMGGAVVGYAYGRLEDRDWNALLDAHGGFHDLWVEAEARCHGAGEALANALVERLSALGATQIVLKSAAQNTAAQRLFQRLGWRPTMVEMTRDLPRGGRR